MSPDLTTETDTPPSTDWDGAQVPQLVARSSPMRSQCLYSLGVPPSRPWGPPRAGSLLQGRAQAAPLLHCLLEAQL